MSATLFVACLLCALLTFPAGDAQGQVEGADADALNVPALIRESARNGAAMHMHLFEYTPLRI